MRVDGKIMFSVFNISKFVDDMGGIENASSAVKKFRKKMIFLINSIHNAKGFIVQQKLKKCS